VKSHPLRVGQRLLQHAPSSRLGVLIGLQHQSRCRHAFHRRCTTPNRRTPLSVAFNRRLFGSCGHFVLPALILMLLGDQPPSIVAGDRLPANVISYDRDAAAVELNQPAGCRCRQVKLEMRQRDKVFGRDFLILGLDRLLDGVEHHVLQLIKGGWRGGQVGIFARERGHTEPP